MTTSLNSNVAVRDDNTQATHFLRKRITYLDTTAVTVGKIPAGASVVGGGVHVITAFNDSGTDVVDVGYIGVTTVAAAYGSLLAVTSVGYIVLDELAATTNIQGTVEHTVTAVYTGQNSNATAGVADVIILYIPANPPL